MLWTILVILLDLVVTRIHRPLRWQSDSHLDCGRRDHPDIQPGLWPARLGPAIQQEALTSRERELHVAHDETASARERSRARYTNDPVD